MLYLWIFNVLVHWNNSPKLTFCSTRMNYHDGSFSTEISTTEDSKFDVTGGINLKLNTAKNIVIDSNGRILVYICNVTSKPADVLQEDSTFKGTVIQLKQQQT